MSSSCTAFLSVLLVAVLSSAYGPGGPGHQYDPVQHEFKILLDDAAAPNISSWAEKDMDCSSINARLLNQTDKQDDIVYILPGEPNNAGYGFFQYAGYVTVDPEAGRALYYYHVEVEGEQDDTPVLLWLNGGGNWEVHSSFGLGALMGHGPFRVNSDGQTLSMNIDYSLNIVANVVYLESPVGVGFSYSNTSSDYDNLGDAMAVDDALTFLVNWFEKFPYFKTRGFYIAGDGYAGHSIPLLASRILDSNRCNKTSINLKGIAIGNGWMDEDVFVKGVYDYIWTKNLISDQIHDEVTASCNFSFPVDLSPPCVDNLNLAAQLMADINTHDLHGPVCKAASRNNISVGGFDSCSPSYVESYLNLPNVQEALHANRTAHPYPWTISSSVIKQWKSSYPTISPLIKKLMEDGTRVWLYSGETDAVVPITSTMYFIDSLQLPVQNTPYSWYAEGKIAGIAVGYENLTFVTVRDGGHFISSYQPARAFTLFSSFIEGKLPPTSP